MWNSNALVTEDLFGAHQDGSERGAVFRLICRLNHACAPNGFAAWSSALGRQTVHAVRDIAAGDEVCLQYIGGAGSGGREQRRGRLRTQYHFECGCALCGLDGAALAQSDMRRERLATLHVALVSCAPQETATLAEEQLALMRAEGEPLVWARAGIILTIAQLKASGELAAAARWARVGAEGARVALGDDSSVYLKFASLAVAFDDRQ